MAYGPIAAQVAADTTTSPDLRQPIAEAEALDVA
jgi:hypothetical protein